VRRLFLLWQACVRVGAFALRLRKLTLHFNIALGVLEELRVIIG
jgi:hypothetical protein